MTLRIAWLLAAIGVLAASLGLLVTLLLSAPQAQAQNAPPCGDLEGANFISMLDLESRYA